MFSWLETFEFGPRFQNETTAIEWLLSYGRKERNVNDKTKK